VRSFALPLGRAAAGTSFGRHRIGAGGYCIVLAEPAMLMKSSSRAALDRLLDAASTMAAFMNSPEVGLLFSLGLASSR